MDLAQIATNPLDTLHPNVINYLISFFFGAMKLPKIHSLLTAA
jgi:hypothetical protein